MPGKKQYTFNTETLSYELAQTSLKAKLIKWAAITAAGFLCYLFYSFLLFRVLGFTSPKTAFLRRTNRNLVSEMEMAGRRLDGWDAALSDIRARDDGVYRPIFGMDTIPASVRNSGFPEPEKRYAYLAGHAGSPLMIFTAIKLDVLSKKAGIQSKSLDEVSVLSQRAGEMAASVPNFNPVDMASGRVRLSSPFGSRYHPILQEEIFHSGVDLSGPIGEPVYATGDGTVEAVDVNFYGYGNCILIDHGFGYKTRYAHLRTIHVFIGEKIHRGDQIATLGNSGRTTGSHLHYEVLYMGAQVNPWNYMSDDLTSEEYRSMVRSGEGGRR